MRKWLTAMLALALCVLRLAPAAAQESPLPAAGAEEQAAAGHPVRDRKFTDEQKEVLRRKVEELSALQARGRRLHGAVRAQREIIRGLWEDLREQRGHGGLRDQFRAGREEARALLEQARPLMEQARGLQEQLRAAVEAGDREQAAAIRAQIQALRDQAAPVRDRIQTLREGLKDRADAARAIRERHREVRERLRALHLKLRELGDALEAAHRERREALLEFRRAVHAGNFGQGVANIEHAIHAQERHNRILAAMLDVLKEITAILEGLKNS